jgi:hypothetical protein
MLNMSSKQMASMSPTDQINLVVQDYMAQMAARDQQQQLSDLQSQQAQAINDYNIETEKQIEALRVSRYNGLLALQQQNTVDMQNLQASFQ